jgi:molybdopterin molybdotransferase
MTLSFEQALEVVRDKVAAAAAEPATSTVLLSNARGRVLATEIRADRDYPPFDRSTRDGYAVRSSDIERTPVVLDCAGEARAGRPWNGELGAGACIEIMTGAPLPRGLDAVVMLEHVQADGGRIRFTQPAAAGQNIVQRGSEARAGTVVLPRGRRLSAGEAGLLASLGVHTVPVYSQPKVAIIPTGDELVPADHSPEWFEIRDSNAAMLASQVESAGGVAVRIGVARDDRIALRALIEQALRSDLLVLNGGVSAGKYDFVESVLAELGAEFYFDSVAIRPGKPTVFGRLGTTFFFGLPGNPVSSYVTFELFARPAIGILGGRPFEPPVFLRARLGEAFQQKHGLTAFMPARVQTRGGDPVVNLVGWQGSGDLVGVAASNCFLLVHPTQTELQAGNWVDVLPKL